MITRNHHPKTVKEAQLSLFPEAKSENVSVDTLYQYQLVITPPDHIKGHVRTIKHVLNHAIGLSNHNMHSIPHISLISFHTTRPVNERFIQAVQNVFFKSNEFLIKLKGFDSFTHGMTSNTIYVKIQNSLEIESIYKDLAVLLGLPVRSFTPHLTVAQSIARSNFEKGFVAVNQHEFNEQFTCKNVTVLERKIQNGVVSNYQVLKDVHF